VRDKSQHRARKRFGQHFLHDQSVIARIVSAIAVQPNDRVVEIGPGTGALTRVLLEVTDELHVIEIDRDLVEYLSKEFDDERLVIHQGDALKFDITSLASTDKRLRVVGNLPYNISTPLLFHLLESRDAITDMHFMLQLEVVNRLAASPGDSDYGRLSVMVQLHCQVQPLLQVPAGAFSPPPKVESAVVRLTPHATLPVPNDELPVLRQIVAAAFSQRRKTLRNALKTLMSVEQIEMANIDPAQRPGTLSVNDYVALCGTFQRKETPSSDS
jgi:16S rRNA (adenine1518-N6/adenine1519-N6)-dimethyltransferase